MASTKTCKECNQTCNQILVGVDHVFHDFDRWTSGNSDVDEFIQTVQLNANNTDQVIEWIPYNRLQHIKYITKGGFGTVYSAF